MFLASSLRIVQWRWLHAWGFTFFVLRVEYVDDGFKFLVVSTSNVFVTFTQEVFIFFSKTSVIGDNHNHKKRIITIITFRFLWLATTFAACILPILNSSAISLQLIFYLFLTSSNILIFWSKLKQRFLSFPAALFLRLIDAMTAAF